MVCEILPCQPYFVKSSFRSQPFFIPVDAFHVLTSLPLRQAGRSLVIFLLIFENVNPARLAFQ